MENKMTKKYARLQIDEELIHAWRTEKDSYCTFLGHKSVNNSDFLRNLLRQNKGMRKNRTIKK